MLIAVFSPPSDLGIKNPVRRDASGMIRIEQSRVTLETVVSAYEAGATAEEIALEFEVITIAQVYGVIAYYLQHKNDLETYLAARRLAVAHALTNISNHQDISNIRKRLLMHNMATRRLIHADGD